MDWQVGSLRLWEDPAHASLYAIGHKGLSQAADTSVWPGQGAGSGRVSEWPILEG